MSPISVIDSPEVLEASTAWPGVAASRSAKTWCLISIFSGTASITKSTSPKPSYSVVPVISPSVCSSWASACSWVSFSFLTSLAVWPWVTSRAFSRPLSTNSCLTSLRRTGMSAEAMTWAISPPMTPAPTTAALKTNMGGILSRKPGRGEPGQRGHAERRAHAPRADRLELGDLDPREPRREPAARERQDGRGRPGALAVAGERSQDRDVAEHAEQRHGDPRQVGVGGLLHGRAAVRDRAHGLGARVMHDREVARDREPDG